MKKLTVKDQTEFEECRPCFGGGKVWEDQGWDDEGTGQTGRNIECSNCEGTGLVIIPVTITLVSGWNFPSGNRSHLSLAELFPRLAQKELQDVYCK